MRAHGVANQVVFELRVFFQKSAVFLEALRWTLRPAGGEAEDAGAVRGADADAGGGLDGFVHREVHVVVAGGSAADHFGAGQFGSLKIN